MAHRQWGVREGVPCSDSGLRWSERIGKGREVGEGLWSDGRSIGQQRSDALSDWCLVITSGPFNALGENRNLIEFGNKPRSEVVF